MQRCILLSSSRFASLVAVVAAAVLVTGCGGDDGPDLQNPGAAWPPTPTVTGHRGASALRPEHTLTAYRKAIDDGADVVEPDLVSTKEIIDLVKREGEENYHSPYQRQ